MGKHACWSPLGSYKYSNKINIMSNTTHILESLLALWSISLDTHPLFMQLFVIKKEMTQNEWFQLEYSWICQGSEHIYKSDMREKYCGKRMNLCCDAKKEKKTGEMHTILYSLFLFLLCPPQYSDSHHRGLSVAGSNTHTIMLCTNVTQSPDR